MGYARHIIKNESKNENVFEPWQVATIFGGFFVLYVGRAFTVEGFSYTQAIGLINYN
jgi:hypothetical protein